MKWLIRIKLLPKAYRLRLRWKYLDREDDIEYQMLEEDEARYHSGQLLRRARELRIPYPPLYVNMKISEDWERSGLDGHRFYLSLIGEKRLRAEIREEEKYQAEKRARNIPYLTALTGLIGAITGLVALLGK